MNTEDYIAINVVKALLAKTRLRSNINQVMNELEGVESIKIMNDDVVITTNDRLAYMEALTLAGDKKTTKVGKKYIIAINKESVGTFAEAERFLRIVKTIYNTYNEKIEAEGVVSRYFKEMLGEATEVSIFYDTMYISMKDRRLLDEHAVERIKTQVSEMLGRQYNIDYIYRDRK